jgi:hypothetical protein
MRRLRRFSVALTGLLVLVYGAAAALDVALPGLGWYQELRLTRDLAGVGVVLGDPLAAYDTPRAFNGDGYSVARYRLPPDLAAAFGAAGAPRGYPRLPGYREGWTRRDWRPTPAPAADAAYLEAALSGAPPALRSAAERALAHPGGWYAVFYKVADTEPAHVMNVDLFVVDVDGAALFIANMNT